MSSLWSLKYLWMLCVVWISGIVDGEDCDDSDPDADSDSGYGKEIEEE